MRILASDVGGTKTLVSLFEGEPGAYLEVASHRYDSGAHPGLGPILREFRAAHPGAVDAIAVGVAGPVVDDRCEATNLPWVLDARAIERDAGVARATLINDFAAVALGIAELGDDDLLVLADRAVDVHAPVAILGAGTGLGEAILLPTGRALPRVLPTEGGHTDFPPRDEIEVRLLRFLQRRHGGRVSIERVLSGPGLESLYDFIVEERLKPHSARTEARFAAGEDRASVIGQQGSRGEDPACAFAVERFVSLYGAEAGNLALKTLPFGGLYVAGGIAPKIAPAIERGDFMRSFLDKGRMRDVLERIRVAVVLDSRVGLLGARRAAAAMALTA